MQVALVGGTGDIGEALALRLGRDTDHAIVIGSREAGRAREAAGEYAGTLTDRGVDATIEGTTNTAAAARGDVVVLAVPAYHLADTIEAVAAELGEAVLVSPAVGMQRDGAGLHYNPPGAGSVTALAARVAPEGVPVVGAFHGLAAGRLADLDAELGWDVPVVGEDPAAKETVMALADGIDGLRALDAGGIENAPEVESLTPLLINLAANNDRLQDLGVSFR